MDIVQEFIQASLKEANRSDASILYNSNLSWCERLATFIAKKLNGRVLQKRKDHFNLEFNLPQNYKLRTYYYKEDGFNSIKIITPEGKEPFYWTTIYFFEDYSKEDQDGFERKIAQREEEKYHIPQEITLACINMCKKIIDIEESFRENWISDKKDNRDSTKDRQRLEYYKKQQGFFQKCLDKYIKTLAEDEAEDLKKYSIIVKCIDCDDGDWDGDCASFYSNFYFTFVDKATKNSWKFEYSIYFKAAAGGWYFPGSAPGYGYDPPDGESWLIDGHTYVVDVELNDVDSDVEVNEEFEQSLMNLLEKFLKSDDGFNNYIDNYLEEITGSEVR